MLASPVVTFLSSYLTSKQDFTQLTTSPFLKILPPTWLLGTSLSLLFDSSLPLQLLLLCDPLKCWSDPGGRRMDGPLLNSVCTLRLDNLIWTCGFKYIANMFPVLTCSPRSKLTQQATFLTSLCRHQMGIKSPSWPKADTLTPNSCPSVL